MNIRQRILASGAIGIVAVVLLGGVGFWGQLRLGKALSENELSVNALRNHMEGDMMHDALRADVLAAFVVQPGDGAAAEQVRQDLQEHSQWFRKVVEQNQGLPLNDAIHQALVELRPDLKPTSAPPRASSARRCSIPWRHGPSCRSSSRPSRSWKGATKRSAA